MDTNAADTVTAHPFEARKCPACQQWIYTAAGPFAEGDRTKTLADADHFELVHADQIEAHGRVVIGFPFMPFNTEPVQAIRSPRR